MRNLSRFTFLLVVAVCFAGVAIAQTVQNISVLSSIPQFGIYVSSAPAGYQPPPGVLMWNSNQAWYSLIKLTSAQQSQIGSDVAAQITYTAGCDNYDRIAGLFLLAKPKGVTPTASDPQIDLAHYMTPFSDYTQGSKATHVFPNIDLSQYAQLLTDTTQDIWIGFAGGSNPYGGDPCTGKNVSATFAATGFSYSLNLVSTRSLTAATSVAYAPISYQSETSLPISTRVTTPGVISGYVTLSIDGHGSEGGGDEYNYQTDTFLTNGQTTGTFTTQMDCSAYAQYSPDGNPGIFQNNTTGTNNRSWCPGAAVPQHTYPVSLASGTNVLQINVNPATMNASGGDYYLTGLNFTTTAVTPSVFANLAPWYTLNAISSNGTATKNNGIDGAGYAFSSTLLGSLVVWNGSSIPLGSPDGPDATAASTVVLAPGYFSKLNILAAGVNGPQTSQTFKVSYADGTSSTMTQSLSDWCFPQNYSGETKVISMASRNSPSGTSDTGCKANVYGYTLNLNNAKLVNTLTLPSNTNVVILGASLVR